MIFNWQSKCDLYEKWFVLIEIMGKLPIKCICEWTLNSDEQSKIMNNQEEYKIFSN